MTVQTEAQRQFYLQVAGISCWYSRTALTGAAPSPDFDFAEPERPDPASVDEPVADRRVSGQARRQSLAAIQGLVSASPGKAARAEAERPPAAVPESQHTAPPVQLAPVADRLAGDDSIDSDSDPGAGGTAVSVTRAHWGFWFSDEFVIVSSLSADASARLQESLAENILRALDQTPIESNSLQWPVFSNPGVPGNDEAGLKAVLRELAAQINNRRVITLGLLPEYSDHARNTWLESVLGRLSVEFPYSLAGLSADPERKRQLWKELRLMLDAPL